jgi:hypothetical protein
MRAFAGRPRRGVFHQDKFSRSTTSNSAANGGTRGYGDDLRRAIRLSRLTVVRGVKKSVRRGVGDRGHLRCPGGRGGEPGSGAGAGTGFGGVGGAGGGDGSAAASYATTRETARAGNSPSASGLWGLGHLQTGLTREPADSAGLPLSCRQAPGGALRRVALLHGLAGRRVATPRADPIR